MIDLNRLGDINYVKDNLKEIYLTHKDLKAALELLKECVKYEGGFENNNVAVNIVNSKKYVPTDINKILEVYPIEMNEEIYNISLSKNAQNIITEEGLLQEKIEQRINIKVKG